MCKMLHIFFKEVHVVRRMKELMLCSFFSVMGALVLSMVIFFYLAVRIMFFPLQASEYNMPVEERIKYERMIF